MIIVLLRLVTRDYTIIARMTNGSAVEVRQIVFHVGVLHIGEPGVIQRADFGLVLKQRKGHDVDIFLPHTKWSFRASAKARETAHQALTIKGTSKFSETASSWLPCCRSF